MPGSVVERQLQSSLSRMFPELLRFSSAIHTLDKVPEHLKDVHRPIVAGGSATSKPAHNDTKNGIWDGWGDAAPLSAQMAVDIDSGDDMDLSAMGL